MLRFTDGEPLEPGAYWVRLAPTEKVGVRMNKHKLAGLAIVCQCHNELRFGTERDSDRVSGGFFTVDGYIKLPEVVDSE